MVVKSGKGRLLVKTKRSRREISQGKRDEFIQHLSETFNVTLSAGRVPEAIRQGIVRMTQHLHDARDGTGVGPPAMIAALWQPWRRLTLGSGR